MTHESDDVVNVENESTISISIDAETYNKSPFIAKDYIILFNDDSRISGRRVEMKVTKATTHILSLHGTSFYPIKRTTSTETLIELNEFSGRLPERCIERKIISHNDGIRLSLSDERTKHGSKYTANAEIEYGTDVTHAELIRLEEKLMMTMERFKQNIDFSGITATEIFSCPVRKLQLWHTFKRDQPFKWACKWNGVKARAVFKSDDTSTLWRDASDVENHVHKDPRLSIMHDLCLQLEEMDDCYIIVEVIAAFYMGETYLLEPHTNIKALRMFHNEFKRIRKEQSLPPLKVYGKHLAIQKYFDNMKLPSMSDCESHLVDGCIIVQETQVIKWKLPTTDVKYLGNFEFLLGDNSKARLNTDNIPCKVNAIYEVSPKWEILRLRTDRHTVSTLREFNIFKISSKALEEGRRRHQQQQLQQNYDESTTSNNLQEFIIQYLVDEEGYLNNDGSLYLVDVIKLYLESIYS